MADTNTSDDASVTFHVKSSSGPKYTISVPLSITTLDLKNKLAGEEYANVPASSQRLIYSGKVLRDTEPLSTYNIKDGNTMHLVRNAPSNQRQNPAASSNTSSAASTNTTAAAPPTGVPQNLAAGTGNDPLAGLTGARYAGFAGLPSLESLAPMNQEDMIRRLEDPNFAQQMNEALQNPQMIDMMINANPQLRAMGPQARQMLQSEQFRRMMTNPESLRGMMEMQRAMGGSPFGMGGGQEAFPMPGATNTTGTQHQAQAQAQAQNQPPGQQQQQQQNQANPFTSMFGGGMNPFMFPPPAQTTGADGTTAQQNQANPFAALFMPPAAATQTPGQQREAGSGGDTTNTSQQQPPPNPFGNYATMMQNPMIQGMAQRMMQDPEAMRNAMQMMFPGAAGAGTGAGTGMGAGGFDPFASLFGGGAAGAGGNFGAPPDNRPPEERYSTQLGQLNEMGFYDFQQNIQALTRSGGDVNGALEWLFSQPPR